MQVRAGCGRGQAVESEAAPGTAEQHATLEDLVPGARVTGLTSAGVVEVIAAQWHGTDVATIVFRASDGRPDQQVVLRGQESRLRIVPAGQAAAVRWRPCGFQAGHGGPADQARRPWTRCWRSRPATWSRCPTSCGRSTASCCRDAAAVPARRRSGAGKTIMAGLYIKELMLREDVKRCLIVVPGGLVDQWQDELI